MPSAMRLVHSRHAQICVCFLEIIWYIDFEIDHAHTGTLSMIHDIKSQLAKLLAMEGIYVEHKEGIATAGFDIKSRTLYLPTWTGISEDLYDMLVVHEVGHALNTPCDGWEKAINDIGKNVYNDEKKAASSIKQFLNVVEDARIDRLQKIRYPGSKRNYVAGLKELYDRDFFGTKGKDINMYKFIDRANIYFKGGIGFGIKFNAVEDDFLRRMDNTKTFEEVATLTEEIFRYSLNEIVPDQQEEIIKVKVVAGTVGTGEDGEFFDVQQEDGESNGSEESSGENEEIAKQSDSEKSEKPVEAKKVEAKHSEAPPTKGGGQNATPTVPKKGIDQPPPEVETVTEAEKNVKSIIQESGINYVYVKYPEIVDVRKHVDDFKKVIPEMISFVNSKTRFEETNRDLAHWRQKEKSNIAYMVKEFEMRKAAETYARIAISKTGVINTNKIHSYQFNDDIFKRNMTIPLGKNHGFFMILDWSGSMTYDLKDTLSQLFSLVLFCKRIQVPFEVYLFKTNGCLPPKTDFTMGGFALRNILSSRMNSTTLTQAMEVLWHASYQSLGCDLMSGTPLNQAIIASEALINEFRNKNKLEVVNTIFLTDDASDPASIDYGLIKSTGKKNFYVLRDPKTQKSYNLGHSHNNNLTQTLLKVLKDRTRSNVIGFYLYSGSANLLAQTFKLSAKQSDLWSENGFVGVDNAGYDEYFIINVRKKAQAESFDAAKTKAKISKVFVANNISRKANRKLLNNFVERISKNIF